MRRIISWFGGFIRALLVSLLYVPSQLLLPDDHHILRYYVAVNRIVQPVFHRVFLLLYPDDRKTVKELLFQRSGYSQTKYRKDFNKDERSKLDNGDSSSGFDITLLYKLLQSICGLADTDRVTWSESGTFENCLKRLKDHRNSLAHENISFTCSELEEEVNGLEELCRSVLVYSGLRSRTPVISDIAEMERGMQDVLLGGVDLWEPYREALSNLRQKLTSILLREGRKDIQRLSQRLRILNPFAWLIDSRYSHLDVEHLFTELSVEGKDRVEMLQLLTTELPSGDLPDVIVLSGPPGYGKSSFFRFLVHDWLSSNPTVLGMENVDLVLPVELRHVCSRDVKDLINDEILQNVSQHMKMDDIISSLKDVSLLWLLDGYDEATLDTRKVVKEIVNKFPHSRVLITTRTEFTHEIERGLNHLNRSYVNVSLKGFSGINVEECAKKLIAVYVPHNERKEKLKTFKKFTQKGNHLKFDIFTVPLYITIIVVLWLENPHQISLIKTRSGLYNVLVNHIIQKLMVRDSYKQLNQLKFVLERKINKFLDHLGTVLWEREFDFLPLPQYEVDYLERICSELDLPFADTMSSFFVCAEKGSTVGTIEEYSIIHRTMTDFLSARAFANKMILENWDMMTTLEEFFRNKRRTLLQHEPHHRYVNVYDVENMSKDLPLDIFQRSIEKDFSVSFDSFFINRSACDMHHTKFEGKYKNYFYKISEDGFKELKTNNLWCHMRDHIGGLWTFFLLGYLDIKQELNESRCEQLVFIFCKYRVNHDWCFSDFIDFMDEADNCLFTKKLCSYLAETTWIFYQDFWLNAAKNLLKKVTPRSVFLHYCDVNSLRKKDFNPSEILIDSIRMFVDHSVDVQLDLRHYLCNSDPGLEFTKGCLEMLLHKTSQCRLVTVTCPVDDDIVVHLKKAAHLRKLTIRFQGENFTQLAELISSLPELKQFTLAIDCDRYGRMDFPVLIRENCVPRVAIIIYNAFQLEPQFVGLSLEKISVFTSHVVLHGRVSTYDLENILAYIYWTISYLKYLKKLEVILDSGNNLFLVVESWKVKSLKRFVTKEFPHITLSFKHMDFADSISGFGEL